MSPEPSLKATKIEPSLAGPSPAAQCARIYTQGIKARYGADYPPSAKLNGIMAALVKELGAEPAAAVVAAYVASSEKWYLTKRHALEYLKRDAAQIWIDLQTRSGTPATPPVTATAFLDYAGAKPPTKLVSYPVDDPERLARRVLSEYGKRIPGWGVRNILIKIGQTSHPFSIEELGR